MAPDLMARVYYGKMWAFSFHVVELSPTHKFVWSQKLEKAQYFDVFSCFCGVSHCCSGLDRHKLATLYDGRYVWHCVAAVCAR